MNKYVTYNGIQEKVKSFEDLKGRILSKVEVESDEIRFYLTDDHYVRMYHEQDCCEHVYISDINGDVNDLVGTPLLLVEESISSEFDESKSNYSTTWTFYRFRTIKGDVDIRWNGSSNGYYSETVDIEIVD